jgi:hypothetical protein
VTRKLTYLLILALGGCIQRYVDAPAPVEEGSFLVHVVRAPNESFPKILTWYTGTTLSQEIVLRYNPVVAQRPLKVGDRLVIPVELVANSNSYGTSPQAGQSKTPNLLMGESEVSPTPAPSVASLKPAPAATAPATSSDSLPPLTLETFADDTSPDHPEQRGANVAPPVEQDVKVQQLQKEIADKQRELERLQAARPTAVGGDDMPPPGLLEEYAGS